MKLKNEYVKRFQTGGEMPTEQAGTPPQQGPEPAPAPKKAVAIQLKLQFRS